MRKTKIIVAISLITAYIFSFSVLADGVYLDYFELNKNSKAGNINTAISKINCINEVNYVNRFSVYEAQSTYNALTDKEKEYVKNADTLSNSIIILNRIGDLSLDGTRDSEDAICLVNLLLGKQAATDKADVNGDKSVDILDLVAVKQLIAGV